MKLRKLCIEDAPLMLEWMHMEDIAGAFRTDFRVMTLRDCERFSLESHGAGHVHYAVSGCMDEYLGTVSLKHIQNKTAEFAIVLRKKAMGSGCAAEAMQEIFRIGFSDMDLQNIYWYVSPHNQRAVRFYDKNGCQRADRCQMEKLLCESIRTDVTEYRQYLWYMEEKHSWHFKIKGSRTNEE